MDEGTVQFLLNQAPTAALALIILVLFIAGKIHSDPEYKKLETERDYWRQAYEKRVEALAIERKTTTELAQAGQVTTQLIGALTTIASARRTERTGAATEDPGP